MQEDKIDLIMLDITHSLRTLQENTEKRLGAVRLVAAKMLDEDAEEKLPFHESGYSAKAFFYGYGPSQAKKETKSMKPLSQEENASQVLRRDEFAIECEKTLRGLVL